MEGSFEIEGRKVSYQILERGKDYTTFILFMEMPDTVHTGYLMKKGDAVVAKGEIAKAVRDAKIEGVEMAVAPPLDSNAIMMLRVSKPIENLIQQIVKIILEELAKKDFL